MITLKNLIDKVEFDSVWTAFVRHHPNMSIMKDDYYNIYKYLLDKESKENSENMVIHFDLQDSAEFVDMEGLEIISSYYQVHGKDNGEWDGYWDISVADWECWLGYYINDEALSYLTAEDVVALCLHEMTCYGLSEDKIKEFTDKLKTADDNEK